MSQLKIRTGMFAGAVLAGAVLLTATTPALGMQEQGREVVSVGGRRGLLNHNALPTVQTPHGYQGEALRLHNKYLHGGFTKRNVFRSSRHHSPFGNVFRSSRHYQQKLAASVDAYPLRTIGHPVRVIGNDYDEVVPPAFIAGGTGYGYGGCDDVLSPFDAAHHYVNPDFISPVPYFNHYEPIADHYGPSNYVDKRSRTQDHEPEQRPSPIEWRNEASETPTQQAVSMMVQQADGRRKIVITSEPIPARLDEAWAAFASGDDVRAATLFDGLTNPGGHATDLSRQATFGFVLAQSARTLEGEVSPDVAASLLRASLEDDDRLLARLPKHEGVVERVAALADQMSALAESSASASSYEALADAMRRTLTVQD